jgi:hypothetical protein
MVQQKLTDALVRQLPLPEKHSTLAYHAVVAGFAAPITRAGARSYVLRYRVKGSGKERTLTIGSATDWSIASRHGGCAASSIRAATPVGAILSLAPSQKNAVVACPCGGTHIYSVESLLSGEAVCSAAPRTPEQRQQQAPAAR